MLVWRAGGTGGRDDGPKIPTLLVECEIEDAQMDMPVEAVFDEVSEDYMMVKFRPV